MKKILFILISIFISHHSFAQDKAFQDGEWLKLRIHYGWFNASYATLEVKGEKIGETPVYHVIGEGKSTGLLDAFYKVDDRYESVINKDTGLPLKFKRNINEGGYKKNKIIYFDQKNKMAKVRDLKHDETDYSPTDPNVQDMISAFYFLRNKISDHFKNEGDSYTINMFFDNENYKFKTVYLGTEIIKTKFGKVKCMKLRPYVQSGRVFKEKESLTVWVSADENKLPIRIKAKLAVGSITADLDAYKGLKHPFNIIMK